jgi:hypothetical protein
MSSALRDSLRTKIFAAKPSKQLIPIGTPAEGEAQQFVEVVQPLVGDTLDSMGTENVRQRIARMIINTVFVPDTSEKVFEEADFDMLMSLPADGTYQALLGAITKNISAGEQEAKAKKP